MTAGLRLRALGGLSLSRHSTDATGAGARRKPLALLAFLAVEGVPGVSRDKLTSVLWPEAAAEAARTALRQTLYTLRRDLQADDLVLGTSELRLNPALISSDIGDLEAALQRGDLAGAAALYRGPFLDGFHLPDSIEFEQWQDSQRTRIEARMRAALDTLATAAEREGDDRRALEHWQGLAVIDPLSTRATAGIMRALAASGDVAAATRVGQRHSRQIREEFESEPDASITGLLESFRARASDPTVASLDVAPPTLPATDALPVTSISPAVPAPTQPSWSSNPWRLMSLVFVLAMVAIVVAVSTSSARRDVAGDEARHSTVAIAPFEVYSSDSSLRYLRAAAPELLYARFTGSSEIRVVDRGATHVLTGSVVGTRRRMELTARLAVRGAPASAATEVHAAGPSDSVSLLADRIAGQLLAVVAGESQDRVAGIVQSPLAAVKLYLEGQRAYRAARFDRASTLFRNALQQDSSFSLAGLRLALASGWAGRAPAEHDWGLARAWAGRDRLIARDRAFLIAFGTGRIPELRASSREWEDRWERAVSAVPDWPEVWYEYADNLFHSGRGVEERVGQERAAAALRRALALDSMFAPAMFHLIQLEAQLGDTAAVRRLGDRYVTFDSSDGTTQYVRWRKAHAAGDSAALRSTRRQLGSLPRPTLRWMIQSAIYDGVGSEEASDAVAALIAAGGSAEERYDAFAFAHDLAMNEGRLAAGLEALRGIKGVRADGNEAERWQVLDAIFASGDSAVARHAASVLAASAERPLPPQSRDRAQRFKDLCVLALWRVEEKRTDEVVQAMTELRHVKTLTGLPEWQRGESRACAALLDVRMSMRSDPAKLKQALVRFDSVTATNSPGDAIPFAFLVRGRALATAGDLDRALQSVRTRFYFAFHQPYLAAFLRDEGVYALAAGDTTTAVRAWKHYLTLRRHAEPAAVPERTDVEARLARLEP